MDASFGGRACRETVGKFLSTERESGGLVGFGVVMRRAGRVVGKLLLDELRKDANSDHIGWWCSGRRRTTAWRCSGWWRSGRLEGDLGTGGGLQLEGGWGRAEAETGAAVTATAALC
jgi:hypothetical protein